MTVVNSTYFVDVFQDIIDHIILEYDPIVTAGDPPVTTGGEKPYGMYGHIKRVLEELSKKDKHSTYKFKKYPLIVLVQDFEEKRGENLANEYLISPRFLILDRTRQTFTASERYTNVFKPVLYILYELLIKEIAANPLIWQSHEGEIKHKKIDRVDWGAQNPPDGFADILDGIDITFADLRVFRHMRVVDENIDDEAVIYAH